MSMHLLGISLVTSLLVGAAPQQRPPQQQQQNRPNNFQGFPIIVTPNTTRTNELPKLPPPKTGFDAPKRNTKPSTPNRAARGITNPSNFRSPPLADSSLDTSDWTKVTPSATGLTFYMPEEPSEEKRTIRAGQRDLEIVEFVCATADDRGAYSMVYSDLPTTRRTTESRILDAARDRIVSALDGRLVNEDKVRLGSASGLEINVKAGNGNYVRQRLYINGDRLVQAIAAGPADFVKSADVDKYLKSFKFGATME